MFPARSFSALPVQTTTRRRAPKLLNSWTPEQVRTTGLWDSHFQDAGTFQSQQSDGMRIRPVSLLYSAFNRREAREITRL